MKKMTTLPIGLIALALCLPQKSWASEEASREHKAKTEHERHEERRKVREEETEAVRRRVRPIVRESADTIAERLLKADPRGAAFLKGFQKLLEAGDTISDDRLVNALTEKLTSLDAELRLEILDTMLKFIERESRSEFEFIGIGSSGLEHINRQIFVIVEHMLWVFTITEFNSLFAVFNRATNLAGNIQKRIGANKEELFNFDYLIKIILKLMTSVAVGAGLSEQTVRVASEEVPLLAFMLKRVTESIDFNRQPLDVSIRDNLHFLRSKLAEISPKKAHGMAGSVLRNLAAGGRHLSGYERYMQEQLVRPRPIVRESAATIAERLLKANPRDAVFLKDFEKLLEAGDTISDDRLVNALTEKLTSLDAELRLKILDTMLKFIEESRGLEHINRQIFVIVEHMLWVFTITEFKSLFAVFNRATNLAGNIQKRIGANKEELFNFDYLIKIILKLMTSVAVGARLSAQTVRVDSEEVPLLAFMLKRVTESIDFNRRPLVSDVHFLLSKLAEISPKKAHDIANSVLRNLATGGHLSGVCEIDAKAIFSTLISFSS